MSEPSAAHHLRPLVSADLHCCLVAGGLENGGVESVVATLARGLPSHGVAVEVVCTSGGRVAEELRTVGVAVVEVPTADLAAYLRSAQPDVVQLHRVEQGLTDAVARSGVAAVPVFHAMESYLDAHTWRSLKRLVAQAPVCIAVSSSVRRYFEERLGRERVEVVVNGVHCDTGRLGRRPDERRRVGDQIGGRIADDDVVVVALQRFSDQKNPAGLVDAFLLASERDPRLRLIVAGAPDNWLEYRRADLLRRSHTNGGRVHLLGDSDPWVLLAAADMFALDSFAEGGPISAVEAVSCGLPVVLSDVGFARELIDAAGGRGLVVPRANGDFSQWAMRSQRFRLHQSNRTRFAEALLLAAGLDRGSADAGAPAPFLEEPMVAGHAAFLRQAALSATSEIGQFAP